MLLINCETNLSLRWSKDCVITAQGNNPGDKIRAPTDATLAAKYA